MFLFIPLKRLLQAQTLPHLNTSYVLIYRLTQQAFADRLNDLNTSYVLIYRKRTGCNYLGTKQFKYILCSYLSLFILKIRGCFYYLNTSYVLIYLHMFSINNHLHLKFKYISCSYLSKWEIQRKVGHYRFKYISCSYLSSGQAKKAPNI